MKTIDNAPLNPIKVQDWHDDYIAEAEHMNIYLISDTHFKHEKMRTYCDRPADFTERIIKNWHQIVKPEDLVIHLGDVGIGKLVDWEWILPSLPGRKGLIRGNHDRQRSCGWWMEHGFGFACDGMMFRNWWLSHEPANSRPGGCEGNIHGHLHNAWHGFNADGLVGDEGRRLKKELKYPWQRLFALEYTNYMPVEFDKFVSHPDKYQARGPHEGLPKDS